MLCPYCQKIREDDLTPCAHCGAASPLSGNFAGPAWTPMMSIPATVSWGGPQVQDNSSVPPPVQQSPANAPASYGQSWVGGNTLGVSRRESPVPQAGPVSLLPVLYQGGMQRVEQDANANMQMLPYAPVQQAGPLVPAPMPMEEPSIVYVPPMYTKLRPIIPRYRIISGFLSLLIVSLLVCGGVGYYAQTSGKLAYVLRLVTGAPPASMQRSSAANLPDPPQKVDLGPAYGVIPSAIITAHVDPNNAYFAVKADTVFKVGQVFYIIYSVQNPKTSGTVTIKWYTNNNFYKDETSSPLAANPNGIYYGKSPMQYAQAAEGMVELYWNNQLAQRLYFVVR